MKRVICTICALLGVLAAVVHADVYVKSKTHTDPVTIMGQTQPAKDQIVEQWIGKDRLAQTTGPQGSIIDLGKKKIYIINHATKTYVESDLPFDLAKMMPPELAPMLAMMKPTIKVAPSGQTKKIGKWDCTGYTMEMTMMMPVKTTMWTTTQVPFDWRAYSEKLGPELMKSTMQLDEAAAAEMKKVEGFQIASETVMEVMGTQVKTTSEVVEISEKPAPEETYAAPAGYTKQERLTMESFAPQQ